MELQEKELRVVKMLNDETLKREDFAKEADELKKDFERLEKENETYEKEYNEAVKLGEKLSAIRRKMNIFVGIFGWIVGVLAVVLFKLIQIAIEASSLSDFNRPVLITIALLLIGCLIIFQILLNKYSKIELEIKSVITNTKYKWASGTRAVQDAYILHQVVGLKADVMMYKDAYTTIYNVQEYLREHSNTGYNAFKKAFKEVGGDLEKYVKDDKSKTS